MLFRSPELVFSMALQAPVLRRSAVMRKERRQHVGIFHHAKKLGMVAQFHEVIRGRCGGRGEPERNGLAGRSEEHTSELQSLMRISYAVFCLKKKNLPISAA